MCWSLFQNFNAASPITISNSTTTNKFQYIGNTEGKIFLKAELIPAEQYGVTWLRAVQICSDGGYQMASITSQKQDDIVAAFVTGTGPDSRNWMWIDGSNFAAGGNLTVWSSLHTGQPLTFFNWVRGRPVSPATAGARQCLRWSSNSMEAGWWDIDCTDKHNVLCETQVSN